MTSVLIALEAAFIQVGVRVTIENTADFEVAGVVSGGAAVMDSVAELRPGIVLLDSHFQKADQQLVSQLTQDFPDCRILVMVDHTDEGCTLRSLLAQPPKNWPEDEAIKVMQECCLIALRDSARGCLPKTSTPETLVAALRAVAAGELWTGPGLASYWMHSLNPSSTAAPKNRITVRELEVIELVVEGLSNREVADRLSLSEQTVKNHAARIMDKLGVRNRVELVLHSVRKRLV